jgi:hypothetical protein
MRRIISLTALLLLTACAAPKFTVDDGRQVDEVLLGNIRNFGAGEQVLRPAIARTAALKDSECDTQWELPFSVASSDDWSPDDRVAWVRGLGVDERLTVIAVAPGSPLKLRDKLQEIDGYHSDTAEKMLTKLAGLRDGGEPFDVTLSSRKKLRVQPFQVCRGYARLAPPNSPKAQDYHWLMSVHPLEVSQVNMDEDEALWLVLWTQGVSEEGGARMKTYHYGKQIVGTLYNIFTVASGIKGAAMAADAAISAAQQAAASVATDVLKQQLIAQATALASEKMRDQAVDIARKLTQQQVIGAMQNAAANRGALSGVAWVASTIFEKADVWAYTRLEKLQANPLAGFSLHEKLIERGLTSNSMVFDPERLTALNKMAEEKGRREDVVAILQGIRPEDLDFPIADMPLASTPVGFSYDDARDQANPNQPFANGLVDGMLGMPVASVSIP